MVYYQTAINKINIETKLYFNIKYADGNGDNY